MQTKMNTMTTEFKITKKWSKKGKVLRSIILGALGNNIFFAPDDQEYECNNNNNNQEVKDEKKQQSSSSSSVFDKLGFLPISLARVVPSSGLNGLRKLGRVVSMRKDDEKVELCKKRIIMGRKCRPLNVSGALHYDKNGVLVPELLLSPYHDSIV